MAEHAGVSAQTVSNLVNNRLRQMSDETRVRIEGAMEQLGYHPNLTARSLRSARTTTIGFLLLDEGARYLADPMTDQVIAGVGDIARDRGYSVLIHAGRPGRPDSGLLKPVLESRVDGVLLFLSGPPEQRAWYPARAAELNVPTVVMEEALAGDEPQMSVTAENGIGARSLADHLIRGGHRRIAFIAARQPWPMVEQRHLGYREALAAAGLERDPSLELFEGIWDAADAGSMVDRLLALPDPPTAIMGGNDLLAIGAMRQARARGLHVPDDLAVTGFNDFAFAEFVDPPLTTVHVPGYEMGCSAAQLLIDHLDGREISEPHITLPVELRLRGSA
ncbi:MAG TPA: LacI family DNA-binding transcriptional regulator [Gaiellales bacterium]